MSRREAPTPDLDAAKPGYRFFDRFKFLDEGDHGVFGVVEILGFFEDLRGSGAGDNDDSVFVGRDDVVGVDEGSGAGYGDVDTGEAVVVDGGGGRDSDAVHGELDFFDLREIANGSVDDGSDETVGFHGGGHESSDAGDVGAIFEFHDVDGAGGGGVYGVEHALGGFGAFGVFFLLHKDGNGGAGEFGGEERTHFMVHVEFLAVELFDGVGYGGDFDLAEAFDEGVGGGRLGEERGEEGDSEEGYGSCGFHRVQLITSSI